VVYTSPHNCLVKKITDMVTYNNNNNNNNNVTVLYKVPCHGDVGA